MSNTKNHYCLKCLTMSGINNIAKLIKIIKLMFSNMCYLHCRSLEKKTVYEGRVQDVIEI